MLECCDLPYPIRSVILFCHYKNEFFSFLWWLDVEAGVTKSSPWNYKKTKNCTSDIKYPVHKAENNRLFCFFVPRFLPLDQNKPNSRLILTTESKWAVFESILTFMPGSVKNTLPILGMFRFFLRVLYCSSQLWVYIAAIEWRLQFDITFETLRITELSNYSTFAVIKIKLQE
jgi:hypothetical protein